MIRFEKLDGSKGDLRGVVALVDRAIGLDLVDDAIKHEHFTIQMLEGSDAGVALCFELCNGDERAVLALEQGVDAGGLVNEIRMSTAGQ